MKKLLIIVSAIIVLTFSTCFAASKFVDVNGTKYENAVISLTNLGVIDGFGDGTFRPQEGVTRAQLCKMLVEGLGLKKANNNALTQFSDVNSSLWSYNYIKVAVDNGIIKGYTDGTFKPNDNVKFSELFTMIIRAMGKEGYVTNPSNWPNSYIEYAQNNGLMTSVYYGSVSDAANRGEVAIAVNNMVNKLSSSTTSSSVTKYGFVTSYSKSNGVYYVTIDGTTYTVASGSKDFEEDTFVVFDKSGISNNVALIKSYGVTDLDANAEIIVAVSGTKAGEQEVKYDGSSKYIDYYTKTNKSKYEDYAICVITVKPNSKDVLVVSKHSSYDSLSDVKFATGDRVIEDSKNEVFVVFKGLDADDVVKKGKYTAAEDAVEYVEVSYEWASKSDKVSGVSLPKTVNVAVGSKYTVKTPSDVDGYSFYATNYSGTITVKKDITIYIATEQKNQGGSAGSNIPLVDNEEKVEYEIRHRVPSLLTEMHGDDVFSVDINSIDIRAVSGKTNQVMVTVGYDAYLSDGVDPYSVSAQGYYDEEDNAIKELYIDFRVTDEGVGDLVIEFV